jgi:hypothetical protein
MFKMVLSRETIKSDTQRMASTIRRRVEPVTSDATTAVLPFMK